MAEKHFTTAQILVLLTEAPSRIAALTEGLSAAQLQNRSMPQEWCENDVLAHLRSCSDVWENALKEILSKDRPTIRAINPTTWIQSTDYSQQNFQLSFMAYRNQRTELLKILKPLTPKTWFRTAMVTGAGKPLERTVFFYARWLAAHERTHMKQIGRIAGTMRK